MTKLNCQQYQDQTTRRLALWILPFSAAPIFLICLVALALNVSDKIIGIVILAWIASLPIIYFGYRRYRRWYWKHHPHVIQIPSPHFVR